MKILELRTQNFGRIDRAKHQGGKNQVQATRFAGPGLIFLTTNHPFTQMGINLVNSKLKMADRSKLSVGQTALHSNENVHARTIQMERRPCTQRY